MSMEDCWLKAREKEIVCQPLKNPRLDFFLLVVSQIFLKIKKLERNSKIIDRRLEREEREQIYSEDRCCGSPGL